MPRSVIGALFAVLLLALVGPASGAAGPELELSGTAVQGCLVFGREGLRGRASCE